MYVPEVEQFFFFFQIRLRIHVTEKNDYSDVVNDSSQVFCFGYMYCISMCIIVYNS